MTAGGKESLERLLPQPFGYGFGDGFGYGGGAVLVIRHL